MKARDYLILALAFILVLTMLLYMASGNFLDEFCLRLIGGTVIGIAVIVSVWVLTKQRRG